MGVLDSLRKMFNSPAMRDRHADREAGTDPKLHTETPSGTVGPGGSTIDQAQSPGGAIEPDPPPDRG
jgi:hypothetical protein